MIDLHPAVAVHPGELRRPFIRQRS